jgi:pimeloyl-ACP methyl ester carboxylesterase
MTHEWFRLGRQLAYIALVLIVGGCFGRSAQNESPPRNQKAISPQECLSEQANFPCFYWRAPSTKKNEKLVIFVHGVFSNPSDTWGNAKSGNTWSKLVRGDDNFKDFDIYLINYHTIYFTSAQMIHEIAARQLDTLKDRDEFEQYKEIYFIAHSMGGLIVKSLLTHLNRGDDVAVVRRVKAVVYLGTPSQGADLAFVASLLSSNPQLRDMNPIHLNAWLSDLEKYWTQLMDDRKDSLYPLAYCAYETINYSRLGRLIVPQQAAASKCDGLVQGLPFNHSDFAVPTTIHRDPYKWVMNKVHKTSSAVIEPSKVKDARESKGSPKVAESSKLLQPMSNGDQVGNIEALLAEVRDPSQ